MHNHYCHIKQNIILHGARLMIDRFIQGHNETLHKSTSKYTKMRLYTLPHRVTIMPKLVTWTHIQVIYLMSLWYYVVVQIYCYMRGRGLYTECTTDYKL